MAKKKKIINWIITSALAVVIAGLIFVYLVPGYNLYLVRSGSMAPAVKMGDVIMNGPVDGPINGDIKPGMIVSYQHGKDLITHRVLSINGETLTMKGDALEDADPWSVPVSNVKGVYLFKIPYIGFALSFIRTKLGWFLAIIIPAAVLVGWLCRDILKEAFSDVEKTSNKKEGEVSLQDTVKETFSKSQNTSDENIRAILIEALDNTDEASKDWEVSSMIKQSKA